MKKRVRTMSIVASVVFTLQPCAAESPAGEQPETPISKECQIPGVEISGNFPLPAVQRAITERKVIKILTIGASSSPLQSRTADDHHFIIEELLEKTIKGVDVQIVDRGVSGELARDTSERLKSEVALNEPDLVLWQLGASDALAQIPPAEFEETVDQTLTWLKDHNVDVVLVGLQYLRLMRKDTQYQAIREAIQRVADRHKVLRVGRYEAMQVLEQMRGGAGRPSPNDFSMTEAGYSCLSEYVVRALTSGIFLRAPSPRPPRN